MRLRILISTVLFAIMGYSLFWYYMAGEVEDRIDTWVGQQSPDGLRVGYDDIEITGFPYRMEITLKSVEISQKRAGNRPAFLYGSPAVIFVAFPWKINHGIIMSRSGRLQVGSRRNPEIDMTIGKLRASLVADLATRTITRASFVVDKVTWRTGHGRRKAKLSEAHEVKIHMLRPGAQAAGDTMELPEQMRLYLQAKDVIAQNLPVGIFGKKADQVKIDLRLHGENLPRYTQDSLSRWRDTGGTLAVKNIEVKSGEMDIDLNGEVTLDQDLKPLGAFSAKVHGIDHMVSILSGHSAFQAAPGNMILQELEQMNKVEAEGGKKAFTLSISLQSGLLFLGPIPVYELDPVVK